MDKKKKLSKNIILFAISSFGTKILSFILVPFYTNFLSTAEYGVIDILSTTVSLLLPVFTLDIYDAVMRFTIDDSKNMEYFQAGIRITVYGSCILACLLCIVHFIFPVLADTESLLWVFVLFFLNAAYTLLQNYMRASDNISVMVVSSLLNSFVMLSLNIIFIACFKTGVTGYFISMACGLIISSAFMVFTGISRFGLKKIGKTQIYNLYKVMLSYSFPLVFTGIAWWVNSSLDRYFVTALCGIEANGIYAVAYKIPNFLTLFQTVFTQAWTISAVTGFDSEDNDGFVGYTYEMYNMLMVFACMFIMLLNIFFSKILYANEFFVAWKYVPYLLVSVFFGALAGFFGGIFAAVKDSKTCAVSTVAGAAVNTILNIVLIPYYGINGAAVATLIAYYVSWVIRFHVSKKIIKMKYNNIRVHIVNLLLILQMIYAVNESHMYIVQVIIIIITAVLYKNLWYNAIKKLYKTTKNKYWWN